MPAERRKRPSSRGRDTSSDASSRSQSKGPSKKSSSRRQASALHHEEHGKKILERRRFSLLIGIMIGCCIVLLSDYTGLHKTGIVQDVLDLYVKQSHEVFEQSRNLLVSTSELLQLQQLLDFTPANTSKIYGNLDRPGLELAAKGFTPKHPVIMIPGIVTTGLELWQGEPCAKKYFRQRMWGTMTMVQNMLLNTRCWLQHMALNGSTGLDPDGIKLRSAQGFEAADFVLGGYWVWSKLIENLADIGYDPGTMSLAAYDWRLSFEKLQTRDRYFSRLTRNIESSKKISGENVVLVTHSMGGNLMYYFFQWVQEYRSPGWVDEHVHSLVSIAAPFLGTPKGVSALLSGEAKDTAEMGLLGSVLDHHIPPFDRRKLFRSWGSALSMLPRGGNTIWGGGDDGHAAPDFVEKDEEMARMASSVLRFSDGTNMTVEEATEYLLEETVDAERPDDDGNLMHYEDEWSHGLRSKPWEDGERAQKQTWANPLESQLPNAPSMTVYCLYGVGKESERGYFYSPVAGKGGDVAKNGSGPEKVEGADTAQGNKTMRGEVTWQIDTDHQHPNVTFGMYKSNGDGSVPLISLGFTCSRAWKMKHFNPGGTPVVSREYAHEPVSMLSDVRGGPSSGDHVDIMGNHEMIKDILKVASGAPVEERILSEIEEISANVKLPASIV